MRELPALRRALTLTALMIGTVVVAIGPAAAVPPDRLDPTDELDDHCVVEIEDQESDGELIFGEPRCFGTFSEAMWDASDGSMSLQLATSVDELETNGMMAEETAAFTLGIHYNGRNGTSSSISIKGSACNGGYWNTGSTWANRISSSYNGCYRLRHYTGSNKTGMQASTTGAGVIRNLPSALNNRAKSVSYNGS